METSELHFTLQPEGIANGTREKLMSLQNSALLCGTLGGDVCNVPSLRSGSRGQVSPA